MSVNSLPGFRAFGNRCVGEKRTRGISGRSALLPVATAPHPVSGRTDRGMRRVRPEAPAGRGRRSEAAPEGQVEAPHNAGASALAAVEAAAVRSRVGRNRAAEVAAGTVEPKRRSSRRTRLSRQELACAYRYSPRPPSQIATSLRSLKRPRGFGNIAQHFRKYGHICATEARPNAPLMPSGMPSVPP